MIKISSSGTKLPSNPKQWNTEVLKALKNQHPDIPLHEVDVKFDVFEPDEKKANGNIIVYKKVAIPFCIREGDKTGKPSLAPLDIMFVDGMFKSLTKQSFEAAVATDIGSVTDSKSKNEYIGNLTGDISPLQDTTATNQGMTRYAGFGLLSRVVRNPNDLSFLFNTLNRYQHLNSACETIGLNDSLKNLEVGMDESALDKPRIAHIVRAEDGSFVVTFDSSGEVRKVSMLDLKDILQDNFARVMGKVMHRGWAIVRDVPNFKSVSIHLDNGFSLRRAVERDFKPIEEGGKYRLMGKDGRAYMGVVYTRIVNFDGTHSPIQTAVTRENAYSTGMRLSGVQSCFPDHPADSSVFETGASGVFANPSYWICTPKVTVRQIVRVPNKGTLYIVTDSFQGKTIGLLVTENLLSPTRIPSHHRQHLHLEVPEESYYLPMCYSFVQCNERLNLSDRYIPVKAKDPARIIKNAKMWTLFSDEFSHSNMDESETRMKLASYGAGDEVITQVMGMRDRQEYLLDGCVVNKTAEIKRDVYTRLDFNIGKLKKIAAELASDMNEANNVEDPKTMDAILSLQFVSEETLSDLVESIPLFEEVEDKLAKLLMASRYGEEIIQEDSTQKALKGIGGAIYSLRNLAIELKERNKQ